MGRPPKNHKTGPKGPWKLTPEVVAKLEYAFSIDASIEEACYYADISTDSYHRWCKRSPDFAAKMERLRLKPILAAREKIVKSITESPTTSDAWEYLKRKRKDEFAELKKTEVKVERALTLDEIEAGARGDIVIEEED